MFRNYLVVAWRNLVRHKLYSAINIAGLTVGLTCCILILLYVRDELSYDRYHEHAAQTYRIVFKASLPDRSLEGVITSAALAPHASREIPEVIAAARILTWEPERPVSHGDKHFNETRFFWADPEIFQVFTLPLSKGDRATALAAPNTVVLTQATARKYFGDEDPMGKTLRVDNEAEYQVTGVLAELPENVHLHFDFLASLSTQKIDEKGKNDYWISNNYLTYLLLREDAVPEQVAAKIEAIVERNVGEVLHSVGATFKYSLQPLTAIHLYSHLVGEAEPNGYIAYVYVLLAIAAFVLLIAGINFVNLATARSTGRVREVGVRKAVGAQRYQLIGQFLGESTLVCLLALVLALALIEMLLPAFNSLTGKHLNLDYTGGSYLPLILLGTVLGVGILAGSYPAFFFSAFEPVIALKGKGISGTRKSHFRSVLVILQFAISIGLIIGTLAMVAQMKYLRNKHLGFDRENLVVVPLRGQEMNRKWGVIKAKLQQYPGIVSVGATDAVPISFQSKYAFWLKGHPSEDMLVMGRMRVDYDFLSTMGMQGKEGRSFSRDLDQNTTEVCIVNEAAARLLGAGSAVGKEIGDDPGGPTFFKIIGVVDDFHFQSLHHPIEPLVMRLAEDNSSYWVADSPNLVVRLKPGEIDETIASMAQAWKKIADDMPFDFFFLDEHLQQLYLSEEKLGQVLEIFTAVAILIACLGLFGLASFVAEQRTKEIGIRKVLGASVPSIVALLSKEFTYLVLAANLIAWPLAWYAMHSWLQSFAYRIELGAGVFVLGGVLALGIAWLTVSYQAIRAARANPVEALRYE